MHKPSALLAAIAFFVALSFVASCGQPEPWEPTADREARAIDRLRYLLEPSEAHAQLFPSTLTDTLRLGKGRYRLIQVESAQNLLVEKFYLGPTSTRPNCNAARSGLFHINSARQVSYCNATAWVPIGGVLRQATPPTCSDSQPVRLYEDSDDDGLYRCVGTTWTKIADDGDGDGFVNTIDADDADDAVFARNLTAANVKSGTEIGPSGDLILTGTFDNLTEVVESGFGDGSFSDPYIELRTGLGLGTEEEAALVVCLDRSYDAIISYSSGNISGSHTIRYANRAISSSAGLRVGYLLEPRLSGTHAPSNAMSSLTCGSFEL